MKKINRHLLACTLAAAASTTSYAAVLVTDGPSSIDVSANDANINGYLSGDDTDTRSFTQTGGSVTVTNTGSGNAVGIFSNSPGSAVSISGGTFTVIESGDGDSTLLRPNDNNDSFNITGGTFTGTESGDGGLYGVRFIRNGPINISGGTWNFLQDDSSVGALFLGGGECCSDN